MITVNFFDNKIILNINLHKGGHVEVTYKGKTIASGTREYCFKKITEVVKELDNLDKKEIYFQIENMTIAESAFGLDVTYFKEHLSILKAQSKSYIEIKRVPFNAFA